MSDRGDHHDHDHAHAGHDATGTHAAGGHAPDGHTGHTDGPSFTPITPPASALVGTTPDTLTRFIAFLIDAVAIALIGLVPIIGGLVGIAYALLRDGLDVDYIRGRSLGKKLMKLTVVRDDGLPMDMVTSARRNWPLVFGSLAQILAFIPVIGWVLIPFVVIAGAVFVVIEVIRVLTTPDGKRLGDGFAGTRVVTAAE